MVAGNQLIKEVGMSQNAKRYQKVLRIGPVVPRTREQDVVTPRAIIRGVVRWTAQIKRAVKPMAEQLGIKVVEAHGARIIYC